MSNWKLLHSLSKHDLQRVAWHSARRAVRLRTIVRWLLFICCVQSALILWLVTS